MNYRLLLSFVALLFVGFNAVYGKAQLEKFSREYDLGQTDSEGKLKREFALLILTCKNKNNEPMGFSARDEKGARILLLGKWQIQYPTSIIDYLLRKPTYKFLVSKETYNAYLTPEYIKKYMASYKDCEQAPGLYAAMAADSDYWFTIEVIDPIESTSEKETRTHDEL